ncbi:MAG: hypothetical protein F6K54_05415 [Okeania sp. SIO3B5]|uniref:hypothetical protein n=1 Tax=Okeania sp. SIO3B5 TaxID=2607811 RepID=UPI0013FF34DB|nr:hypothetical protein [Okeania sp. SIO3B5]NEO52557.1 hypothetical protein [Okeania sp. SIO3B5]
MHLQQNSGDYPISYRRRPETFESKLSKALGMQIEKGDLWLLAFVIAGFVFVGIQNPGMMTVYLFVCLIAHSVKMMIDYFPPLGKLIGVRFKAHHVAALVLICCMIFSSIGMPAHALLFDAIEAKVNEILTGSGSTVDPATVTLIFTVLRVIVILGILVGGIFLVSQAMQGGDWKPIGNMMAIGVGFVLAIEVMTQLILGSA